ncbi:hypothetical protein SNE40_022394 [Patella caerulea]|uniref:G-protein coupled receptors family 1 profile domain-containing protein n=1 Tax=Patella caerulea TaxID=87958 RepID=A0AAN8J3X1_PATCE
MARFNSSTSASNPYIIENVFNFLRRLSCSYGTILLCFASISFVVNILILRVYIKSRTLRRMQDILLAILSVVSIYISLAVPFYMSYMIFPSYVMVHKVPCLLFGSLVQSGIMTSSFVLLSLGFERYFFITQPFTVLEVPIKRLCFLIFGVFILFTILGTLPVMGYNYWDTTRFCQRLVFPKTYYTINQILALSSVGITTFCHLWTLKVALKHIQQIAKVEENLRRVCNNRDSLFPKRERHAMFTVGSILLVYLMCYLPHYTVAVLTSTTKDRNLEVLRLVAFGVLISNSLVSPLIYAKSSRRFMNQARVLFCNVPDEYRAQFQRSIVSELQTRSS